jgi:hypothetical protein
MESNAKVKNESWIRKYLEWICCSPFTKTLIKSYTEWLKTTTSNMSQIWRVFFGRDSNQVPPKCEFRTFLPNRQAQCVGIFVFSNSPFKLEANTLDPRLAYGMCSSILSVRRALVKLTCWKVAWEDQEIAEQNFDVKKKEKGTVTQRKFRGGLQPWTAQPSPPSLSGKVISEPFCHGKF